SFSGFQFLLRAFYAMQDTRTPALVNLAATTLNVVLDLVLIGPLGVPGLALGQTIAYTVALAWLWLLLHRRIEGMHMGAVARPFVRASVAGLAGAGAALAA